MRHFRHWGGRAPLFTTKSYRRPGAVRLFAAFRALRSSVIWIVRRRAFLMVQKEVA